VAITAAVDDGVDIGSRPRRVDEGQISPPGDQHLTGEAGLALRSELGDRPARPSDRDVLTTLVAIEDVANGFLNSRIVTSFMFAMYHA